MILPGFDAVIGARDSASVGRGMGTVPDASHDTVICLAGSLPQVSSSCSGAVVVGSGRVVVGGPDGGVVSARAVLCASASAPALARPAAAPTTTTLLMNCRRDSPPSKSSVEEGPEPKMPESSMPADAKGGG